MAIKLIIGADPSNPLFEFNRADIKSRSLQVVTAVDVVGSELSADEVYADVDYRSNEYVWFSPADHDGVLTADGYIFAAADQTPDISLTPYATPVWLVDNMEILHKLYFSKAEQIDPKTYSLTAISGIGLLERRRHRGNLYTGQTVAAVLYEIIGDAFLYTVDAAVGAQSVYGLLLPDTARKNLHKLTFAMGISVLKGIYGDVHFVFLDAETDGNIPASRVFLGGSVTYQTPTTAVEVTEHSYFAQSETTETIFDNSGETAVDHILIEFDNAYSNLSASGSLTINESGATYAVVSGTGKLTGNPYVHQTRTVRLLADASSDGEKVIKPQKDTLINGLNSQSVAYRLLSYHGNHRIVNLSVRLDGEKPGHNVDFAGPFGNIENGFILKSESIVSSFERANLKLLVGYVPTGQGNWYSQRMIVTTSGTITIPAGVSHVRMVLIQGGHGGQGGMNGADGYGGDKATGGDLTFVDGRPTGGDVYYEYAGGRQNTPLGGSAGAAGSAGKVLVVDINVTAGASVSVVVGAGGTGGASNGGYGSAGGHTTATIGGTTYSSANGTTVAAYVDPLTGAVLATPGAAGQSGANGGRTDIQTLRANAGAEGYPGSSLGSYAGGTGGQGKRNAAGNMLASGGGGGGAAWGAPGDPGEDGKVVYSNYWRLTGGTGGNGANASAPATPTYGCGGAGGNGGGAGGNGAGCWEQAYAFASSRYFAGAGGTGGTGSIGGAGGPGVCLIFY